jgi:iron complex outermembrane receptor protein
MNKFRFFIASILLLIPAVMFSQMKVNGTVTEVTGEPLPGVNIQIVGTTQGTTSDFDGKFQLENVQNGSILEFSYIGFVTQQVKVANATVNVVMKEDAESLDEVVVIGYGSTTKKDATGSVAKISTADLKNEGVPSAEQMLVGKVAGVTITPNGTPGGGGTIRIRESTSLFANQDPLIVIDGVPGGSLYNLNNNDIESFSILKDASATAIYGSRASNGVILVTTKKGRSGELKVTYDYSYTSNTLGKIAQPLNADQYREYVNTFGNTQQISLLGAANTDWQDLIFDNASGMKHDMSLMGGSDKINYRIGLGFAGEDGVLKTSSFQKGNYSVNLGTKFFKDKLKINASYHLTLRKHRNANTGAISSAISFDPTQSPYDNDPRFGGYFQWLTGTGARVAVGAPANPLALIEQSRNMYYENGGIGNVKFDLEMPFVKDLHANLVLGIDHRDARNEDFTNNESWTTYRDGNNTNFGYIGNHIFKNRNKLMDVYFNYNKELSKLNSKLELTAGYSYQDFKNRDWETLNLQDDPTKPIEKNENYNPLNLQSFFGRANFNLKDKYLFTASFRRDGTSRFFHSNNTWIDAPSAAFAWKINEDFFKDSKTISDLKLRLGWGIVGQQDIPGVLFPALGTYLYGTETAQYQMGNGFVTTARAEPYNPLIKWENTTTFNVGIEYGLFENKLTGVIEVFKRLSEDLLNRIPFPAGSSLSNENWANIGNLENNGIELSLNAKAIDKENMKLNFGFNAAYNTLEITKLTASDLDTYFVKQGSITGGVGNYIQAFHVGNAPYAYRVYEQVYDINGKPIEGAYVDRNKDGVISSKDMYYYKKPNADFNFGLNTDFSFKSFDFNMFWRASLGNYIYNNIDSNNAFRYVLLNNAFPDVINNGVVDVLNTNFINGGAERYFSDYYIQDASFVKLDNLTLGYTFKEILTLSKVRIYGSARNVLTITNYSGPDPEVFGGIDYNVYPKAKTYSVGLNVNF